MSKLIARSVIILLFLTHSSGAALAADGRKITITGEVMDTWCYVSQIMGSSNIVVGSSHHVCAVWCAAGGIPVGLLDKSDGQIYMIMGVEGDTSNVANEALLSIQSHEITVTGMSYDLDGIKYLMIDEVSEDQGVTNLTHETFGIVPGNANPQNN